VADQYIHDSAAAATVAVICRLLLLPPHGLQSRSRLTGALGQRLQRRFICKVESCATSAGLSRGIHFQASRG